LTTSTASHEVRATASNGQDPRNLLMPEEIAGRTVPSDPRISPDGTRVVFVASPASKAGENWTRSLWISGDRCPTRQFTTGAADDNDPRWSPDGSRILFRSDRLKPGSDDYRLFVLSASGG
jgi:dipeptidyl aminopeptidase/acylaminoacyl peptidase